MSQDLKITILIDNKAGEGLMAEHGFSLCIEAEGKQIIFDTGPGKALVPNARALDIDLAKTDVLVLSHGHYDHTGGVPKVLERTRSVSVYCHPDVMQTRYGVHEGKVKPAHIPNSSMVALKELPAERLRWVSQPLLLSDRIGITGPIPRETSYEDTGGHLYLDPEIEHVDMIHDDLALWIRTKEGLVVCLGCTHAGLVNTLNYIKRLNDGMKIHTVIGGLHLLNADNTRLEQTVAALQLLNPDKVVPCHCTGKQAVIFLRDALGEKVTPGASGMRFFF